MERERENSLRNQVFKPMSLWWLFLFKSPHHIYNYISYLSFVQKVFAFHLVGERHTMYICACTLVYLYVCVCILVDIIGQSMMSFPNATHLNF